MPFQPPSFNQLMAFIEDMPKEYDERMRECCADPEFKALSEDERNKGRLALTIAFYTEAKKTGKWTK